MLSQTPDIVYILRSDILDTQELTYSLRSLTNLQHGKVWTAGGRPPGIKPDNALEVKQQGETKWAKVAYTLRKVCNIKELSQEFYLFNDDFFIMQPTDEVPIFYNKDLTERIRALGHSQYRVQLQRTADELTRRGLGTKNYAVHIPMLIDKDKALEVLDEFEGFPMFRSLYGNYWDIGGIDMPDVKISQNSWAPAEDAQFLSTSNVSFKYGIVGKHIRRTFTTPCEYEEITNG